MMELWDIDKIMWKWNKLERETVRKEMETWWPQSQWDGALMPIKPSYNEELDATDR